jgi:hypothetical protein
MMYTSAKKKPNGGAYNRRPWMVISVMTVPKEMSSAHNPRSTQHPGIRSRAPPWQFKERSEYLESADPSQFAEQIIAPLERL